MSCPCSSTCRGRSLCRLVEARDKVGLLELAKQLRQRPGQALDERAVCRVPHRASSCGLRARTTISAPEFRGAAKASDLQECRRQGSDEYPDLRVTCLVHWPAGSDDLPGRHLLTEAEDNAPRQRPSRGRREHPSANAPARRSGLRQQARRATTRAAPISEMSRRRLMRSRRHAWHGRREGIIGFARARNAMAAPMDHAPIRPFLGDQPLQKMCRTAVATTLSTR